MKYSIEGEPLPVVICQLEQNEKMITEKGAMSWMSPNMKMETVGGGVGKMFGRMFSGESMFVNHYTAMGGPGEIAFASSFPGAIRAFDISPGRDMICQKTAFLASTDKVEFSVHFQKKLEVGCSAEKGLLCRNCREAAWRLWNLTVISKSITLLQDSRLSLTPDIWRQWMRPALLKSRKCRA